MAQTQIDQEYEEEKKKTKECTEGLHSLLGHATYSTRRQLIAFLEQEAEVIRIEVDLDEELLKPTKGSVTQTKPGNLSEGVPDESDGKSGEWPAAHYP